MIGWLVYTKKDAIENKTYIDWFVKEAAKQQIHLQLVYRDTLSIGIVNGRNQILIDNNMVELPDFVVIRTIEPILQAIFENSGVYTFNTSTISKMSNHKSWMHLEIYKLGIPMVSTIFTTKDAFPSIPPFPYPLVVKEATGRSGKQVYLIQNDTDWNSIMSHLSTNDLLIQSANVNLGKDVRVFVIGKEIIAAVLRQNDSDFRANYKLGGSPILYPLTDRDKIMIQKIVNHFNFGLVGIDFLINNKNELIFNEVEDVVGSRILSKVSHINLLEKYVTYIKRTLENM